MKKLSLTVIIVLVALVYLAGCATVKRKEGYGPDQMPTGEEVPLLQDTKGTEVTGDDTHSAILKQLSVMNKNNITGFAMIANALTGKKPPVKTSKDGWEKPAKGTFTKTGAPADTDWEKNMEKQVAANRRDINQLSDTAVLHGLKLMEKADKYHVYRIGSFQPKSAALKVCGDCSTLADQTDELINQIEENDETIVRIIGFTDDDGYPGNPDLSLERAEEVQKRLALHRPDWVTNITAEGGGPTKMFGLRKKNRCVIVICEKK